MGLVRKLKQLYGINGSFIVTPSRGISENLRESKNKGQSGGKGVYVFSTIKKGKERIVYIGKAGTLQSDGSWGKQDLFGRISNKNYQSEYGKYNLTNPLNRQAFFNLVFAHKDAEKIKVYWFVTWDGVKYHEFPSLAEAKAMQFYYDSYKRLPEWNNKF